MNYLAHLFLAGPAAESLIGNLAGDFVKGRVDDRFPLAISDAIRNHRRVDAFTDSHPAVAEFRRVLIPEHGHYSRIISDVFFDHFLASSWDRYSNEPLTAFLRRIFATIDAYDGELPGTLGDVYPRMRDGRWLASYASPEGIFTALSNLSHRLSRHPHLETATHHLTDSRAELEPLFHRFFPQVVAISSRA